MIFTIKDDLTPLIDMEVKVTGINIKTMKTKEFDLELAIQGHPLVTRKGEKVEQFHYFKSASTSGQSCTVVIQGSVSGRRRDGRYFATPLQSNHDLFLDVSEPFIPEPKEGDLIEVRDSIGVKNSGGWNERTFLFKDKNNRPICVATGQAKEHASDKNYTPIRWVEWRPISKPSLDITIKLNGKEVSPSEISEETWNNLRTK